MGPLFALFVNLVGASVACLVLFIFLHSVPSLSCTHPSRPTSISQKSPFTFIVGKLSSVVGLCRPPFYTERRLPCLPLDYESQDEQGSES